MKSKALQANLSVFSTIPTRMAAGRTSEVETRITAFSVDPDVLFGDSLYRTCIYLLQIFLTMLKCSRNILL